MDKKSLKQLLVSILSLSRLKLDTVKRSKRLFYSKQEKGRIYIMGTGPSLGDSLSKIASDEMSDYIAVNAFGLSESFLSIKPEFYIMLDPAFWMDSSLANGYDVVTRNTLFEVLLNKVTWKMQLVIPNYLYKNHLLQKLISSNGNLSVIYFNYTNIEPIDKGWYYYFVLKRNIGVVPVGNVLGGAIYAALNLGYKDIRIVGAEHTWTKDLCVNSNNQVCTIKRHHDSVGGIDGKLIPWLKPTKEPYRMSEILERLALHFRGYEYLNKYSKTLGARIVNYTPESYIDAFDRGEL